MAITQLSPVNRGLTHLGVAALLALGLFGAAANAQVGPNGEIDGLTAQFVDVNGVRTRYFDYGEGEIVVLVHGGGQGGSSTSNNWSRNVPGLAERFRVIAVDRLAQGMTGGPVDDADFTNEGAAQHLYQFIQTLNLGQVHLVGHSSGGGIAFYVAVEHPEVAKTLTVLSAGPQMPPAGEGPTEFAAILATCPPNTASYEHRKCRLLALAHTEDTFPDYYADADDFMGNQPGAVESRERMAALRAANPDGRREQNRAYMLQAWEKARAGALQMPIMLLTAKQDTLSWDADDPHAMMRRELGFFDIVGANNPRVKLVIINDAGHFPYREHPQLFNAELTHFIHYSSGAMASHGAMH